MLHKKVLALLFVFAGSSILVSAQNTRERAFSLSKVEFNLGLDQDQYQTMSLNQLMQFATDPNDITRDLSGLNEEASLTATGGFSSVGLRFKKNQIKHEGHLQNQALLIRLNFHSPKESMVSYKNEDWDTSLVFCNLQKQVSTEVSYIWDYSFGQNDRWNFYFGTGWSGGISYSNEMLIISGQYFGEGEHPSSQVSFEENTLKFSAKPVIYNRFFVPFGLHKRVTEHFTIGIDGRRGVGFQNIIGGPSHYLKKAVQFSIGTKYIL